MRVATALAAAASLAAAATAHSTITDAELESIRLSAEHGLDLAMKADKITGAGRIMCNCSTTDPTPQPYADCLKKLFKASPKVPADFPLNDKGKPNLVCHREKQKSEPPSASHAKRESESGAGNDTEPAAIGPGPRPRQLVVPDVIIKPNPSKEEFDQIVETRMSVYCPDVTFPELEYHCRTKITGAFPDYPADYPRNSRGLPIADRSALLSEEEELGEEAGAMENRAEEAPFDLAGYQEAIKRGCEMERRMAAYCPPVTEECRTKMRAAYPEYPDDYPRNRVGMPITGRLPIEYELVCKAIATYKPESEKTDDVVRRGFW